MSSGRRLGLVVGLILVVPVVIAVTGLPFPENAERAYAAFSGLVAVAAATAWMWRATPREARFRASPIPEEETPTETRHPAVVSAEAIETALRLGESTMGHYSRLLEPRLTFIARARFEARGWSLYDSARGQALLGESYRLVDPHRKTLVDRVDRVDRGVPIEEVETLVEALESLE